jgi:hypothetical protein
MTRPLPVISTVLALLLPASAATYEGLSPQLAPLPPLISAVVRTNTPKPITVVTNVDQSITITIPAVPRVAGSNYLEIVDPALCYGLFYKTNLAQTNWVYYGPVEGRVRFAMPEVGPQGFFTFTKGLALTNGATTQ